MSYQILTIIRLISVPHCISNLQICLVSDTIFVSAMATGYNQITIFSAFLLPYLNLTHPQCLYLYCCILRC